jgi:Rrf2 family protein
LHTPGDESVNISAKTEYACLAVMELAANYGSGEPVRVRMIAQLHGIPSRFLVQILLQLKGAGLVASTRGAAGGYQLAKQPSDITLADVMGVIEGTPDEITQSASSETANSRVLLSVWNDVGRVQRDMLNSITFAELIERAQSEAEYMYYI